MILIMRKIYISIFIFLDHIVNSKVAYYSIDSI